MATENARYLQEILMVLRSQIVIIFLIIIPSALFLIADQGQDVSLCVVEDLAFMQPATTASMLIGLFFWSISTRFCSRMITFLTDNSGHELSPFSVKRRKRIQRRVSNAVGLAPIVMAFFAFVRVGINAVFFGQEKHDGREGQVILSNAVILVLIAAVFCFFYWLYYRRGIEYLANRYRILCWLLLPADEAKWIGKLYGLFGDLRFQLTRPTAAATGINTSAPLPVNVVLPDGRSLPAATSQRPAFTLCPGYPAPEGKSLVVWMYQIPVRFYRSLHMQFRILLLISVAIITAFAFCPIGSFYAWVGTIGCVFLAVACWQAVYTLAHYADKVKYRWKYPIPVRTILFILFMLTTWLNHDHPVREHSSTLIADKRLPVIEHFNKWLTNIESSSKLGQQWLEPDGRIPVIFITAEGGALRTGGFTTSLLSRLADTFKGAERYIYAYSSVSGGSIGCNVFNAFTRLKSTGPAMDSITYDSLSSYFYKQDFLAPAIGKYAFGEIFNYYIPFHIPIFDRAIALEKAWEDAFDGLPGGDGKHNFLSDDYFSTATADGTSAALFTNTVEVETGRQCLWSNVRVEALPRGRQRDLFGRYHFDLPYSTATGLSSRFPLVSPAAAFYPKQTDANGNPTASHYVDGGYYENKGSETMLQVIQHLENDTNFLRKVRPYVIQINFGTDKDSSKKPVRAFSDIREIIGGIANSRGARGELEQQYLKNETKIRLNGIFISVAIPSDGKEVPNDWVLSSRAVGYIRNLTDSIVRCQGRYANGYDGLQQLFTYDLNRKKR